MHHELPWPKRWAVKKLQYERIVSKGIGIQTYSAEIGSNARAKLALRTGEVLAGLNGFADIGVDRGPVWTSVHGTSAEECQGVVLCTSIVDNDIPHGCLVELLRKVNVDAQEVG
jgi:hypothetical protein